MKTACRFVHLASAVIGLALFAAVGPVKGGFDLNHYILGCGSYCPSIHGPAIYSGSVDATFTGAWYDAEQSGHGLFLEVLPDNRLMAFWFTFNPAGTQQAWLVGTGTFTGNVASFDSVVMPTGGRWIPNFDATKIVDGAWGAMTLTFTDYDHGRVDFRSVLGYGTGSMNLTRLTRPIANAVAAPAAPGQWIPTGNFMVPRDWPTLVTLANGNIMVVGGGNEDLGPGTYTNAVERYDPLSSTWSGDTSLHTSRRDHTATALSDGRVLVVGGFGYVYDIPSTAELYDPATSTWSVESGPGRVDHTATLLKNGKVLVVGGYDYSMQKLPALLYDPGTHLWSNAGQLVFERSQGHRATLMSDGRVLVTGGVSVISGDSFAIDRAAEIYDPVAGTWSRTGDLHVARLGHTATLLPDGKVLVAGGAADAGTFSNVAELYDPATGQWTITGSSVSSRAWHTASLLPNGSVLVTGGIVSGSLTDSAEMYDPSMGSWNGVPPLPAPRALHAATVLAGGNVLVVGGIGPQRDTLGNNITLDTAELYGTAFPSGTIVPGFTGTWFDPAQSGHGLLVEVLPDAQLHAWWFTFNPAGTEQSWFGGLGTYQGDTATISSVIQPTGGRFIPNFDPSKIVNNAWGTLTFTFTDCNHGRVDFASTSGYGAGSMNLTRLTQPVGVSCP